MDIRYIFRWQEYDGSGSGVAPFALSQREKEKAERIMSMVDHALGVAWEFIKLESDDAQEHEGPQSLRSPE